MVRGELDQDSADVNICAKYNEFEEFLAPSVSGTDIPIPKSVTRNRVSLQSHFGLFTHQLVWVLIPAPTDEEPDRLKLVPISDIDTESDRHWASHVRLEDSW